MTSRKLLGEGGIRLFIASMKVCDAFMIIAGAFYWTRLTGQFEKAYVKTYS